MAKYLLGRVKHVASHSQLMIAVAPGTKFLSPSGRFLNRYIHRVVDGDVCYNQDVSKVMVYTKLPMFMFFSVVVTNDRDELEPIRIKKAGQVEFSMPAFMEDMVEYLLDRSKRLEDSFNAMSPVAREMAERALAKELEKSPQRVHSSHHFQVMRNDLKIAEAMKEDT